MAPVVPADEPVAPVVPVAPVAPVVPVLVPVPTGVPAAALCSKLLVSASYWPSCTIGLFRLYGYSGYRSWICCGPRRLVIRARSISSRMLPRRSQAIAFSQEIESTGVHCCGL